MALKWYKIGFIATTSSTSLYVGITEWNYTKGLRDLELKHGPNDTPLDDASRNFTEFVNDNTESYTCAEKIARTIGTALTYPFVYPMQKLMSTPSGYAACVYGNHVSSCAFVALVLGLPCGAVWPISVPLIGLHQAEMKLNLKLCYLFF